MFLALFLLSQQAFCYKQLKSEHIKSSTTITEREEYISQTTSITIEDTSFENINSTGKNGGALFIKNSSITINSCHFKSCSANNGGAIAIEGSGSDCYEITIHNGQFQGCIAQTNGGSISVSIDQRNKHITIDQCTFTQSSAKKGGAIHAIARDLLTIKGCTFNDNSATSQGSSLWARPGTNSEKELNDTLILEDNVFTVAGKGNSTNVYITNLEFSGSGDPPTVYIGGCTFSISNSEEGNFKHLKIDEKIGATNQGFKDINFHKCNCVIQGSNTFDIPQKYLKNINFECTSIESCTSNVQPPSPDTPDLPSSDNRIPNNNTLELIDVQNTTFSNLIDTENSGGGAICVSKNKVNLTVTKCTFQGCSASQGGAIYVMYSINNNFTLVGSIVNSNFNSNQASSNGGAIFVSINQPKNYSFTIDNCNFRFNKGKKGGALHAIARDLFVLSRCSFTDNEATTCGSSLYLEPGWNSNKDKDNTIVVRGNTFKFTPTATNKCNVQIQTKTGNSTNAILTLESNKFIAPQPEIDEFLHLNMLANSPYQSVILSGCNCVQHDIRTAVFPASIYPISAFMFNCDPNGQCTPDEDIDTPTEPIKPDTDGYIPHERINDEGKVINLKKYKFTEIDSTGLNGGAILDQNKNKRVSCTLTNCKFTSCKAQNGGAIYIQFAGDNALTCTIKDTEFTKCEATANGGAIYFTNDRPKTNNIEISSCIFTSNTAKNGGALYLMAGDNFAVSNCVFNSNVASLNGSSVWCRVGFSNFNETQRPVLFTGCTFTFAPAVNSINVYIENANINASRNIINAVLSFGLCRFESSTNDVNTYKQLDIETKGDGFQSISFPDCICVGGSNEKVTIPEGYRDTVFTYNCESFGTCPSDSEGYKYHERIEDVPRTEPISLDKYKFKSYSFSGNGGAITINKQKTNLTLSNCKFDSCNAAMGGAIYILYAGTTADYVCTVTNCVFVNNEADSNGGAFYCEITQSNHHSVTIKDCQFTTNKAGKNGGAVYAMGRDRFTLEGCTFTDNYSPASGIGSSVWLRCGYNTKYYPNKIIVRNNKFTFTPVSKKSINVYIETFPLLDDETPNANLEIGQNEFIVGETSLIGYLNLDIETAYSAFESITFTGCSCVHDEEGTVSVPYPYETNTFNFNCRSSSSCSVSQAKPVPSPDNEGYTPAERIQLKEAPAIRLSKTKFTNIQSNLTGGAVSINKVNCSINDCKFTECKSNARLNGNNDGGGAIFLQYSTRDKYFVGTIVSCQFIKCETTSQGGALNIKINQAKIHSVSIEGCTFTNNKASNFGGAIYSIARDLLSIQHCTFTNNEALNGSSIWCQVGWSEGKDDNNQLVLYNNKFSYTPSETNAINVFIQSNELKENIAPNANVFIGLCSFEGENVKGESKHLIIKEKGAFQSISFTDCNCIQGEQTTVTITTTVETNIDNLKFNCVNMDQCKPADSEQPPATDECKSYPSHQEYYGQKISLEKACFYNLKSTTREGGAARIVNSNAEIENCRFINCTSVKNGGAVYVDYSINNCEFEIESSTFENCESNSQGGALYFSNVYATESSIEKCIFINNHAESHGGALYYSPCENSILSSCLFVNNSCTASQKVHGSAVYVIVQNVNTKSASKARLTDDDEDTSVIISGNKIRSQPTENTQQMYINVKKTGNVKIDANSFSFNGANITTASSKYLQVNADDGAAIKVANKLCVDHDGTKTNLISGIDFEVDYNCHKADSEFDGDFDPVPQRGGKKSNTGMIVGVVIGVIVAIAVVAVVVYFLLRKKSEGRYISDVGTDGLVDNADM